MIKENELIKRGENFPAMCQCGHIGNIPNSHHADTLQAGHGSCRVCFCEKFSWKYFLTDPDHMP